MGQRISHPYLLRIQLVGVSLSIAHDTDFHGEENVRLLSLYQGQPRLVEIDIVFFHEVFTHAHVSCLAGGFLSHIELVLVGIESRYLLHCPDLGF